MASDNYGTSLNPSPLDAGSTREPRSPLPWIIAGVVVLALVGVLLLAGRHHPALNPGGAGLAPAAPYAANLVIAHVQMSESANLSGGKETYLDGDITNRGAQTVKGVTTQVAFHNDMHDDLKSITQKETMPLNLIRTREPYVDTQPVAAAPIKPGETRGFRLIFEHVAVDWDQRYPELRLIQVDTE